MFPLGSTQFALTVQVMQKGCLALFFASTPSVHERSTRPHPFAYCPQHFPVARSVLPSCRDVVVTMSCALLLEVLDRLNDLPLSLLARYTQGFGHTPFRDFTRHNRRALLNNST